MKSKGVYGYSLLEVMIAAVILVTIAIPLVRLVSASANVTVKTGNYDKAAALLAKFIEEVKLTPFAKYQAKYDELKDGAEKPLPEEFYPDTLASIETLKEEKEFWIKSNYKASTNSFSQLVEVAVTAEIFWHEKGDKSAVNEPERTLRDYALIFNPEAKFE